MSILETNVVDFIGVDPSRKIAKLGISDHLEWSEPEGEHLLILQGKINTYLSFIEGGELYQHFPSVRGCRCEIELLEKYPLSPAALDFFEKAKAVIREAGFNLSCQVG
ncbi:MAG: hypothetical protein LBJ65_29270 [Burkholderia sp.]|jgi:hypothetical protein|uniref:DUF6572 domain-containing protein n=1 Tax=Burkholderia sp. TaxID=36773 RepID=UPI0028360C96|nr:DUF6572 domain-containing protein [Burkholderia sp.]MDR0245709.1 hypothetical protein [Burkholderia sp.]